MVVHPKYIYIYIYLSTGFQLDFSNEMPELFIVEGKAFPTLIAANRASEKKKKKQWFDYIVLVFPHQSAYSHVSGYQ